jgi:1-aminocyclopropane-1-carboxylate deaminase
MSQIDDMLLTNDGTITTAATTTTKESDRSDGWVAMDGVKKNLGNTTLSSLKASSVEKRTINGRNVFIKRDDLLRLPGSSISGNKARKMFLLNQLDAADFPTCIVSYGGPQSNAMLALAAVVNYKNRQLEEECGATESPHRIRFVYYTKTLPRFLRKQASGNLFRATSLGMELHELSHKDYQNLFGTDWGGSATPPMGLTPPCPDGGGSLWIPQGGAFSMAQPGAMLLAQEIVEYWKTNHTGKPLTVILPGGTCTTAVLLHHAIKSLRMMNQSFQDGSEWDIEVVVVPCVGDGMYAQRQMMSLSVQVGSDPEDIPHILSSAPESATGDRNQYFSFADPHRDILDTYMKLRDEQDLVLDLIYGAPAWTIMMRHWAVGLSPDLSFDPRNPLAGRELMYVHSGGLEGINSQLMRYQYKGLIGLQDIQLP